MAAGSLVVESDLGGVPGLGLALLSSWDERNVGLVSGWWLDGPAIVVLDAGDGWWLLACAGGVGWVFAGRRWGAT